MIGLSLYVNHHIYMYISNERKWPHAKKGRWYPTENKADADYANDLVFLTKYTNPSPLHNLEQVARVIGFYIKSDKTEFMGFKQNGTMFILNYKPLKLVDYFPYLGSNISSTESDVSISIRKA